MNTDNVIEISELSRRYGTKKALDSVSINVPHGCVFGLLGESGAGKTTLIQHLIGLMKPQHGSVHVLGMDPIKNPEAVLSRVGYLSEDRDLPGWMTIAELMRYTQGLYPHWDTQFATDLIQRFDLQLGQKIKTLSKGQKAKTGLVTALSHKPELLILDEPSSGLDPVVRRHIVSAVMRNVADEGRTILFSSHLLDEVERVSDYVAIIHRGKLLLCDKLPKILAAHTRIKIHFPQDQTTTPKYEGALNCEGHGQDWTIICDGKADQVRAQIAATDAQVIEDAQASLEDIFVARIGY